MAGEAEMWSMNKQELIAQIALGRTSLDDALARVGDNHMDLVILHGEWSVKDLIGHLAFWEESVVELFYILRAGKTPEPFELDGLNAQALAKSRKHSLADLREEEKAAYRKALALVNDATDDELFNPAHFPWTGGRPFEELLRDNTCGHYEEHMPELTAWLKRIA